MASAGTGLVELEADPLCRADFLCDVSLLAVHFVNGFAANRSWWVKVPAVVCVSLVIGTISYYLVEMRFLRRKARFMKGPTKRPERTAVPSLQPVIS